MGWIITLGVVVLLAALPLGVRIRYDAAGLLVKIIAGPLKFKVFPLPKKGKEEKKPKKTSEKKSQDSLRKQPQPPQKPKEKKTGGSLMDFLPLVKTAIDFLGDFRRKLRLNNLELKLILAADDPCDLAVNYGQAWAAVGNLMPQLENWFVIKKRNVEVECDFTASQTLVIAHLDLTITLGRLLAAVCKFAIRALTEYMKLKKKRKGGAVK